MTDPKQITECKHGQVSHPVICVLCRNEKLEVVCK